MTNDVRLHFCHATTVVVFSFLITVAVVLEQPLSKPAFGETDAQRPQAQQKERHFGLSVTRGDPSPQSKQDEIDRTGVVLHHGRLTPREIYERDVRAVVFILAFNDLKKGAMLGSGSVITNDGHVLTNAHVILDSETNRPFQNIRVFFLPEKRLEGEFTLDIDPAKGTPTILQGFSHPDEFDLALLRIDKAPTDLHVLPVGNPKDVGPGERVLAIGHPEQKGFWSVTNGIISAEYRDHNHVKGRDVFQTDAAINRGNSGGPLLDEYGRMVGINTYGFRVAEDGQPIVGLTFAVKSSVAYDWLQKKGIRLNYTTVEEPTRSASDSVSKSPETPRKRVPSEDYTESQPYRFESLMKRYQRVTHDLEDTENEMRNKIPR